jgi:hypothetical protein
VSRHHQRLHDVPADELRAAKEKDSRTHGSPLTLGHAPVAAWLTESPVKASANDDVHIPMEDLVEI